MPDDETFAAVDTGGPAAVRTHALGVPPLVGSVLEEGFIRRTKALLRTAPLHRLAGTSGYQGWGEATYDPRVLALAAIDAVVARMGFANELSYEEALGVVAELARIAEPERPEDEHVKVASYVLDGLLNDRDQNDSQAFSLPYSDYTDGHVLRDLRFFLLVEKARPDGRIVLEASTDAINVFRGGLNLRVEDAQMAMELVLQAQLERGDLDEAEVTAEQNQRLSYEMGAKIRALLDATRSDVTRVDWGGEVLSELDRARAHVGQRISVEEQILAHLAAGDEARETEVKDKSLRVAALLEGCLREHRTLHERLMGASAVFLDEQRRQELRYRGHGLGLFSCADDLLSPMFEAPMPVAAEVGRVFLQAVSGPVVPRIPRLSDLVPMLLRHREPTGDTYIEEEAPDFADFEDDVEVYDPEVVEAASIVVVRTASEPVHLSELLAQARTWDREVEELVRLSVLWAFAPEHDEEEVGGIAVDILEPGVVAVATGELLVTEGWAGDDLLVGPVELLVDEEVDGEVDDEAGYVHHAEVDCEEVDQIELEHKEVEVELGEVAR
jgi:hypothetical protein